MNLCAYLCEPKEFLPIYIYKHQKMDEIELRDKDLKERIKWLIRYYQLNDATFAQNIQTNRSTLSQCLNGPNGVSKELIMKIHDAYPTVSLEWLMIGTGEPFKAQSASTLDKIYQPENEIKRTDTPAMPEYARDFASDTPQNRSLFSENKDYIAPKTTTTVPVDSIPENRRVVKIMVFYSDNTFETYSLDSAK